MTARIRFADVFAGIGGFRLAFESLGAECAFSCEIDPHARKTYAANFFCGENLIARDITQVDPWQDMPKFDVLCAGFPCQPFSQVGQKRGFADADRGNMFFELVRILNERNPRAYFFENVRGLLKHDDGRTFETIRSTLENEGYSCRWQIVKASDHGLPQPRPRVFIVGFLGERTDDSLFRFPPVQERRMTMSHVFGAQCDRDMGFTLRVGGKGSGIEDRRNWDTYVVDGQCRRITSVEAKRMQGFPEDFVFPVSEAQAMKQLGNSVAVPAVRATARAIMKYLERI